METFLSCPDDDLCPIERAHSGTGSPGLVDATETVVRGAYEEKHYSGTKIKIAFIKEADFRGGTLSFWRRQKLDDSSIGALLDHLRQNGPPFTLKEAYGLDAGLLRSLKLPDGRRYLCVVDDTSTGENTHHPAHCALRICEHCPNDQKTLDKMRQDLLTEFQEGLQV